MEFAQTTGLTREPAFASQCVGCGKCERHCPQHIPIIQELKKADKVIRPWYFKAAASVARKWLCRKKKETGP